MDAELRRLFDEMRTILLARRERIAIEIAHHPRPVTACDVHFNRLLEERALLSEELDRLETFIAASPFVRTASIVD